MNKRTMKKLLMLGAVVSMALAVSVSAYSADRLVVEDGIGTMTFKVGDDGSLYSASKIEVGIQGSAAQFHTAATGVPATFVVERTDGVFAEFLNGTVASLFSFENGGAFWIAEGAAGRIPGTPWSPSQGTAHMVVKSGGNVGIGITSPAYLIDTGGAYCDGSQWVDVSSREVKDDIKDLSASAALQTLESLNPVTFKYKKDLEKTEVGFIAEDVPDLVATKDRKGLSSMDIVAVVTKVVKEQQKLIQDQQAMIAELKDKVAGLETDMQMKKDKDPIVSSLDLSAH